jgi:hypothetical protein
LSEINPVITMEYNNGEYRIRDVSGKTPEETLSKYISGGKPVRAVHGREPMILMDLLKGRYGQWNNYVERHPEVKNKPPEVQADIFEREILGRKEKEELLVH